MITVNASIVTRMTVKGGGKTYHWASATRI